MSEFLKVSYEDFKTWLQSKSNISPQRIGNIARAGDSFFKLECLMGDDERTDYDSNFSSIENQQVSKSDSSGVPLYASETPSGNFDTVISHNFCNKNDAERPWADPLDSTFDLQPGAGKIWTLERSEVQFEHDLQISGVTKLFIDYYIHHPSFPGNPIVAQTIELPSIRAIFDLGNDHFHAPSINTEIPNGLSTVQFNYRRALKIYGDETPLGLAKVSLRLENHTEAGGSYATVGFVIVEEDA